MMDQSSSERVLRRALLSTCPTSNQMRDSGAELPGSWQLGRATGESVVRESGGSHSNIISSGNGSIPDELGGSRCFPQEVVSDDMFGVVPGFRELGSCLDDTQC